MGYRDRDNEFEGEEGREFGDPRKKSFGRRRACRFCADTQIKLDYKDVLLLAAFVSEKGKIHARRMTGNCSLHQRATAQAIKRARFLALLSHTEGFHMSASDSSGQTP